MALLKKKSASNLPNMRVKPKEAAHAPNGRQSLRERINSMPKHSPAFMTALSKYSGIAAQRGIAFDEVIGTNRWEADFGLGKLSFGVKSFNMQFLGTESFETNTWLWGIENVNQLDESMLKTLRVFKASALMKALEELSGPIINTDSVLNGSSIASIAAAYSGRFCYYRLAHRSGFAYILVEGAPDPVFYKTGPERVSEVIKSLIIKLPINHKILVESMFRYNGAEIRWEGGGVTGAFSSGGSLYISFDGAGNIASMSLQRKDRPGV